MTPTSTRWRRRLALAAFGTSTMLTGFALGYAFGLQHTLQRVLVGKETDGV